MASVLLLHSLQRGRWRRVPGVSSFCGLHECRSMSHKQELPSTVAVRCSSSSAVKAMTPQPQGRLAKALYRQLLRWCQGIGYDVPLSTFIPPITLHAPTNVDGTMLLALATKNEAIPFPTNTIITPTLLTVPIHTVMDAKLFFQAIYRINCHQQQYQKERVTWAFQAIKSLNELTEPIEKLTEQRAVHMNRDDVEFHVGQVVQHNSDRWRGVVVGWERRDDTKPSSLTSKKYTNTNQIQYTMLLDSGDMHLIRRDGVDRPMANQSELTLVQDASLCRIHSAWIPQDFDRFDVTTKSFVPNPTLAYIYPCDGIAADLVAHNKRQDRANELGRIFIGSIQDFASRLERCVLDITSSANSRKLSLLASYEERILALSSGDVVSNEDKLSPRKMTDHALATLHLRRLLAITLELPELLFRRRLAQSNPVQFKLGDIVVHTKYGFRGVVVAWDPKPMVDVSRWDGLTHIENPNELPFYHILPDQTDCIKVFGGERQFRYVCEKNLEPCPRSRTNLNVEMIEDGWEENKKDARYNAPDEAKVSLET
jgi:hemimethylated DNA binding protein